MTVTIDKYQLYLASVQDPIADIERVLELYSAINKKEAHSLREDFCGSFALSCAFVQSHPERKAISLDIDEEAIDYGKKNYLSNLNESEQKRLKPLVQNSLSATEKVDVAIAFNFSYCLLHTRKELVEYFTHVYNSLEDDGMLVMDTFGGSESEIPEVIERYVDNNDYLSPFTYEFERVDFNAVNRIANYYIHFIFDEGTELRKAFHYEFRMWSINEIRDCLADAGFESSHVFWEECDEQGYGNGNYYQTESEENTVSWNALVVGHKKCRNS